MGEKNTPKVSEAFRCCFYRRLPMFKIVIHSTHIFVFVNFLHSLLSHRLSNDAHIRKEIRAKGMR